MGHIKKLKPCAICGEDTYTKYCPLPKRCKQLGYNKNQREKRQARNIKDIVDNKQSIRDKPKTVIRKSRVSRGGMNIDPKWLHRNYENGRAATQGSCNSFNI